MVDEPLHYRYVTDTIITAAYALRQEGSAPPLIPCHAAAASPRHEYPHVAASQPHRNRLPVAQPRVCVSLFSPFGSPCILDSTRDEEPESEPVLFAITKMRASELRSAWPFLITKVRAPGGAANIITKMRASEARGPSL